MQDGASADTTASGRVSRRGPSQRRRAISRGNARLMPCRPRSLPRSCTLTRVDRTRVAEPLLSSLDDSDPEVATVWTIELERRSREVIGGHGQTISWEAPRIPILKEGAPRRA